MIGGSATLGRDLPEIRAAPEYGSSSPPRARGIRLPGSGWDGADLHPCAEAFPAYRAHLEQGTACRNLHAVSRRFEPPNGGRHQPRGPAGWGRNGRGQTGARRSRPRHPGSRGPRPIHCTAVGKSLAAWLPEEELAGIIARTAFDRMTPQTITSPAGFRRELARIRATGFAMDDEEHMGGIRCMAAPVRDHSGEVRASLCVVGRKIIYPCGGCPKSAGLSPWWQPIFPYGSAMD